MSSLSESHPTATGILTPSGNVGTAKSFLDIFHEKINLPKLGGVSIGIVLIGGALVYLAFFRRKKKFAVVQL